MNATSSRRESGRGDGGRDAIEGVTQGRRYDSAIIGMDRHYADSGSLRDESGGADTEESCPTQIQPSVRQDHLAHRLGGSRQGSAGRRILDRGANQKNGESKYAAATAWVPLVETGEKFEDPTLVWEGGCRVHAEIAERKDGRIKVFLDGWAPFPAGVTVSLADEPGCRETVAAETAKTKQGAPYVAVLICPPPEKPAVVDHNK